MNHMESSESTAILLQNLKEEKAIGVSDGSFFPSTKTGVCAWILASCDGKEYVSGGGITTGPPFQQSAFRSELSG